MYRLGSLHDWTGRDTKINDEYIFQRIRLLNMDIKQSIVNYGDNDYALLGFCSDEGIKRNQGRIGAAEGAKAFRRFFAKMPAFADVSSYYDAGDVVCVDGNLELAQKELAEKVLQILSLRLKPIIIGGGHETAWGHFLGIERFFDKNSNSAILNFDSHFDLRAPVEGLSTSGTSFYQISEYLKKRGSAFNYYCAGIQRCANTQNLFDYADTHSVQYILAEQINNNPTNLDFVKQVIEKHDHIYISICLDVFSASIAPGVSAPQALGIYPNYVIQALKILKQSDKVISLDIVELSPLYDINQLTVKLAACLIFEYLGASNSKC